MTLDAMLRGCAVGAAPPLAVSGLQYDSRRIGPGDAFFAFPGERVDGHDFVPQAMRAGAAAVVSECTAPAHLASRWVRVRHGRRALARASLRFYGHPDRSLRLTAVTGTNGKTTTAHLLDSILRAAGRTTALLGTIRHRVGGRSERAVNTTPESLDIVRLLAELRGLGGSDATLEASSHALALGRIHGLRFGTAVFTNLTPEHLDFHGDMASYAAAKRRLFEGAGAPPPRWAVINADDPTGRGLLQLGLSESVSFGRAASASVRLLRVVPGPSGMRLDIDTPRGPLHADTSLAGEWNVENILAAVAASQCNGLGIPDIERGLAEACQVPGRFETIDRGQPFLTVVDYAHTEDALRRLIGAGRTIASGSRPPGRVLTLFGCGGDRDRTKRAPMGRAAGELSDFTVVTSDNPRGESPTSIIAEVQQGLRAAGAPWAAVPDRRTAIGAILQEAREGDVVLIAGKGHETTQVLADRTVAFDDRRVACDVLAEMGYQ